MIGAQQFKVVASEVQRGGGRLGVCPATSVAGKKIWNELRRKTEFKPMTTDPRYGCVYLTSELRSMS